MTWSAPAMPVLCRISVNQSINQWSIARRDLDDGNVNILRRAIACPTANHSSHSNNILPANEKVQLRLRTTYIHNWSLQPFSQDYASHATYVVWVNFIHERQDLQFEVDSERQIFEKLCHGNVIYYQSFCQKSAERKSLQK